MKNHALKGVLLSILGVLILVPDSLTIRLIYTVPLEGIAFLRALGSGIVLPLAYMLFFRKNILSLDEGESMQPRLWVALLFMINHYSFPYAIHHSTVAGVLFIIATAPLFSAVFSVLFLRERPSLVLWSVSAVMVGALGIIGFDDLQTGHWNGSLAAFISVINISIVFCIIRKYPKTNALSALSYSGIAGMVIFAIFLYNPLTFAPQSDEILALLIMIFIVQPFGLGFLSLSARYISPPQVSLVLLLESVLGPLLVWLVIAERPEQKIIHAGTIIIVAVSIYCIYKIITLKKHHSLKEDKRATTP